MNSIKFILSLIVTLVIVTSGSAQSWSKTDTLNANETLYWYPDDAASDTLAQAFKSGDLWVGILSDSLSGTPGVVTEVQYSSNEAPYIWVTATNGTLTSGGATTQTFNFADTDMDGAKVRVKQTADSGAQAIKIGKVMVFKRK